VDSQIPPLNKKNRLISSGDFYVQLLQDAKNRF
jgi:hypothetical protein